MIHIPVKLLPFSPYQFSCVLKNATEVIKFWEKITGTNASFIWQKILHLPIGWEIPVILGYKLSVQDFTHNSSPLNNITLEESAPSPVALNFIEFVRFGGDHIEMALM